MFSRAASFTVLALPLLATAIAFPGGGPPPPTPTCSAGTGSLTCCNSSQSANSLSLLVIGLLNTLGISIGGLEGLVGITCSAAVGGSCSQQTLCCTNDTFNGLVAIGCNNINI